MHTSVFPSPQSMAHTPDPQSPHGAPVTVHGGSVVVGGGRLVVVVFGPTQVSVVPPAFVLQSAPSSKSKWKH